MDPDATLQRIRLLIGDLNAKIEYRSVNAMDAYEAVVEAFTALDQWLSKGGFLPADWRQR